MLPPEADSYIAHFADPNNAPRVETESITPRILGALQGVKLASPAGSDIAAVIADQARMRFRIASDHCDTIETALGVVNSIPLGQGADKASMSVPASSDVWYLYIGIPVYPTWHYNRGGLWYSNDGHSEATKRAISPILAACGNVEMLTVPRCAEDIGKGINNGVAAVKEARYELAPPGCGLQFGSKGPRLVTQPGFDSTKGQANKFCGYISLPIGAISYVKSLSMVVEKITDEMIDRDPWDTETKVVPGGTDIFGGLFAPTPDDSGIYGLMLLEDGFTFPNLNVEYPAQDYPGYPPHPMHQWLRYYFHAEATFPTPGEFVGFLYEPQSLHCWWFQKTSPLLYAGHFVESFHYTTGTIKRVLSDAQKEYNEISTVYVVEVRGYELYMLASDFCAYEVNEKVALLKRVGIQEKSFSWDQLDDISSFAEADVPADHSYTLFTQYVIVPVTFYQNQET